MRKAGILMHITSLPGPYGVGTMGKSAYAFLDFLHKSGQQTWQMLPLGPTGYGDSPYRKTKSSLWTGVTTRPRWILASSTMAAHRF